MRGNIADVFTHVKFYDSRFRSLRVPIARILPFWIGLTGRPYNSVGLIITVLRCDL